MAIKGQNLRVFIGGKCIASATSCSLNINAATESSTTKDSDGNWDENEVTGKSWDVSTESLVTLRDPVSGGDGKTSVDLIGLIGETVTLTFDQALGTNNRVAQNETIELTGSAILTKIGLSAANRQNSTLSCEFQGSGALAHPTV